MLSVGVDWAEDFHCLALGRHGDGIVEEFKLPHQPGAVERLVTRIAELEADPAEVRVLIETRHGLLVEALLDAGFTVLPVNPDLVARRRGPARKKDDGEDARILCRMGLDHFLDLRKLVPHGELASELRAIARDDARAAQDQRRLLNRLRMDLLNTFPAALGIAGEDLAAPTGLRLLERWPTQEALAAATGKELVSFARSNHHGWPERFAEQVRQALGAAHFVARPGLVRAKAASIRLGAQQLLLIGQQRKAWEHRMAEILLGARRHGRARRPKADELGEKFPDGEIYLSFPGLGDRLAARVAAEIGDHFEQFGSPNSLQCYAGKAPVTRRSGKSEFVVSHRLACNRHLSNAVQQWAFCSLRRSGWAREFYDAKVARGLSHHAALRSLGNRWLEVLWHCLHQGVRYQETVHVANRNRALGRAA
jgi:transposase